MTTEQCDRQIQAPTFEANIYLPEVTSESDMDYHQSNEADNTKETNPNLILTDSQSNDDSEVKGVNWEINVSEHINVTKNCNDTANDANLIEKANLRAKARSASLSFTPKPRNGVRRKCTSESEVLNIEQNDIDDVIGKYVEKLIRSSILKAVRNVSIDNIKEEIVNEITNRSSSESSDSVIDFVVEQRLTSNSISELVELTEESVSNRVLKDDSLAIKVKRDKGSSDVSSASFEGYQADNEEANTEDIKSSNVLVAEIKEQGDSDLEKSAELSVEENENQKGNEISSDEISLIQLDSPEADQDFSKSTFTENVETQCEDLITVASDYLPSLTVNVDSATETMSNRHQAAEKQSQGTKTPDEMKVNWKVGYLHVKLPHKSRGKTSLKVWKKKRVVIQPDEFVNDPKFPSIVISIYGSDKRKHNALFWQNVSSRCAVVYRSSSRTHCYAFTISEDNKAVVHLSADSETATQEWIAAIRNILWPASPFMQLEKMLSGREFEISLIDNEFSLRAGLLGMYGYLTITTKKLILVHPQEGYVIQEWYLNTVDKFQLVPQPHADDARKVLAMTTCSDSSTGEGEILIYCSEAVTLLQSLAATIHEVLSFHNKQEGGGRYKKELEDIADWLTSAPQDAFETEDNTYKVPPRQVKSLLDIPNFIFNKTMSPVASAASLPHEAEMIQPMDSTTKQITTSNDSGISTSTTDDYLNCSTASFKLGGGPLTEKSSDSELSDTYTPPRTPEFLKKLENKESGVISGEGLS